MIEMTPEQWRDEGQHFRWRGHRVFVHIAGHHRLPTLLLLHGFPSASWDWHPLVPTLSQHFRCISPDWLGLGFSDKPVAFDYTVAAQADMVTALLADCGIRKAHVLAHDYGDTVAQELLARDQSPSRGLQIESLCMLNGGLFPDGHQPLLVQRALASRVGPLLVPFLGRRALARSFGRIFGPASPPTPALLDGLWTLLSHDNGQRVLPKLLGYLQERRQFSQRWREALQHSDVPRKLIVGMADPISGSLLAQRYREYITDPDVHALQQIGHYPHLEAKAIVLDSFLALHRTPVATETSN